MLLAVVLTAQVMVTLDGTVVTVALPHIERALGFSSAGLSWVLNAYVLAFGGLLLLGARAGDLFGRRRTFLIGISVFGLASLFGGFATTGWMLLAARTLQGVGAALAAPSSLAFLTATFPEGRERLRAIGLFTAASAAGGATGLVAGGLLTEWFSWRWVMFVNVPIGVAVLVTGWLVLEETPRRHGRLDLAGAATSTLGTTGIVLGLVEAGSRGWATMPTLVPLLLGAMLLWLFVGIERRAAEPILPLRLLAHRGRNTANIARALVYGGMYGSWFFLSQFLQDLLGYSPLRTGVSFLALPASVFLASQLASKVLASWFAPKTLTLAGIVLSTSGLLVATRLHLGATYPQMLVSLVLVGAGSGMALVSLTSASLADVESRYAGAASGLVNVAQQVGAAFGLAAIVTVFGDATAHAPVLQTGHRVLLVHGFDMAFAGGAIFGLVAFAVVSLGSRTRVRPAREALPEAELELQRLECASSAR